ncbi:hypothetical protein SKAU_G00139990 [Synaphobranchus kaupii]|uniref:Uncharacterized protein n=1 Tax=Synaphobranchus kaupii TaxID=118154 RepID=A0A9Q1FT28_SYNKA|nr:hypothetical protein SKAU_G00139990 [Synaphobranchus kaupii]
MLFSREPISKAKTDQQVPGAAGNSGDLPEPQNIGLLDRASQHHYSGRSHEAWPLLSMLAKRGYSQTAPQLTERSCLRGKMSPPRLTNKTPLNPKTSGSWIKPPSTTTLGEGRWETGWTSAEKTEGLANSQRLIIILHEEVRWRRLDFAPWLGCTGQGAIEAPSSPEDGVKFGLQKSTATKDIDSLEEDMDMETFPFVKFIFN